VRVVCRLGLRLAEDQRRTSPTTRPPGDSALQAGIVQVACLLQVHLAAIDHGLQLALFDAEVWIQGMRACIAG